MAQTVTNSSRSHCFTNLQPESLYRISVHSVLGAAEGAAVSILHPTGLVRHAFKYGFLFSVCNLKLGPSYFLFAHSSTFLCCCALLLGKLDVDFFFAKRVVVIYVCFTFSHNSGQNSSPAPQVPHPQ